MTTKPKMDGTGCCGFSDAPLVCPFVISTEHLFCCACGKQKRVFSHIIKGQQGLRNSGAMDRTSRTHFGMDERGLGGTHMIQQQFLHMYRRIQTAEKLIDNEPPTTGVFRRPTFSQFGDYWKRVQPVKYNVESKVDHAPPVSFPLLEDLYINQKLVPGASFEAAHKTDSGKRTHTGRTEKTSNHAIMDLEHAGVIEGVAVEGMPESMITYLGSIHKRKVAVAEERDAIRKRRLLRHQLEVEDALHRAGDMNQGGNLTTLARDTLYSLDMYASQGSKQPLEAELPEEIASPMFDGRFSSPGAMVQQESLLPLQSLVLKSPCTFSGVHDAEVSLHATRSTVRSASMRSKATAASARDASDSAPLKKSISALNPELLAASAPKKLVLRKPQAAPSSHNPRQQSGRSRSATIAPASTPTVSFGTSPRARAIPTGVRDKSIDTSMSGHQYTPIVVSTLGAAAATPIVLPSGRVQQIPSKVIGLMQRYDDDDDCATCDDHHMQCT
jgi:hypothetical protein